MDAYYSTSFLPYGAAAGGSGYHSPVVQKHVKLVYLTLCVALASSAVGAYLHVALNIGGMLTMLGCVGSIVWLFSVPVYEERKRFGLLLAAALLEGASVGPLTKLTVDFDPSILVTAFVGTAIAFGCFSCAAIIAERREYLYLGGLLSSGLSILVWLQFAASIFGYSTSSFMFEVYFGLLIFVGCMVYDTQEIIARAHHGDMNYIEHALTLFTDFVAVTQTQLGPLGQLVARASGANFTHHILNVAAGEDVNNKVISFSQQGPRAICILTANGVISKVELRRQDSSGFTWTSYYEGCFKLLSLSGSFTPTDSGGTRGWSGGMSVSLADTYGRVIAGQITDRLVAASPVQVVVGSFLPSLQVFATVPPPPPAVRFMISSGDMEDSYSGSQLAGLN